MHNHRCISPNILSFKTTYIPRSCTYRCGGRTTRRCNRWGLLRFVKVLKNLLNRENNKTDDDVLMTIILAYQCRIQRGVKCWILRKRDIEKCWYLCYNERDVHN
jgi:hypothetical protein